MRTCPCVLQLVCMVGPIILIHPFHGFSYKCTSEVDLKLVPRVRSLHVPSLACALCRDRLTRLLKMTQELFFSSEVYHFHLSAFS